LATTSTIHGGIKKGGIAPLFNNKKNIINNKNNLTEGRGSILLPFRIKGDRGIKTDEKTHISRSD